jgi:uncharacterized membrane protein
MAPALAGALMIAMALLAGCGLVDAMSWAVTLPHMLAVLGLLFAEAGVGKAVAQLTTAWFAVDSRFAAVALYCIGMALFTVIMGNDWHVQRVLRHLNDADGGEL